MAKILIDTRELESAVFNLQRHTLKEITEAIDECTQRIKVAVAGVPYSITAIANQLSEEDSEQTDELIDLHGNLWVLKHDGSILLNNFEQPEVRAASIFVDDDGRAHHIGRGGVCYVWRNRDRAWETTKDPRK